VVDAVAVVRDELIEAAARGVGEQLAFAVGEVMLEFSVELREDSTAKAGFRAWVLSAEAGMSSARGNTHKVSVTLTPRSRDGGELLIAGSPGRSAGPGDVSKHIGR
jgi:hypothetical protein